MIQEMSGDLHETLDVDLDKRIGFAKKHRFEVYQIDGEFLKL